MAPRTSRLSASAEQILADHDPGVRALSEQLREVICQVVPDAVETANLGWHSLSYRHPVSGYFCGLFPRPDGVNLAFEFGALLPDPHGLLTGDGLQVRYVRVKRPNDIRVRALRSLLRAAVNLPASREVKLRLIRAGAKPVPNGRPGGR